MSNPNPNPNPNLHSTHPQLEMITMELNEKWEASLDNIPIACRERYRYVPM